MEEAVASPVRTILVTSCSLSAACEESPRSDRSKEMAIRPTTTARLAAASQPRIATTRRFTPPMLPVRQPGGPLG